MHNTATRFGFVTRVFHWLTALLIIAAIVLGMMAHDAAFDTADALARKAWLFSMHKTVGITAFFVAIFRIIWAISQPRPVLLNAGNTAERTLAELVHWALYVALVVVPLAGWISHAASEGFAPIWWPFGQNLWFIPKSVWLSSAAGIVHMAWQKILLASIMLHIIGALKHHFWDKDDTLRRMAFGLEAGDPETAKHSILAPVLALAIFGGVAAITLPSAIKDTNSAQLDLAATPSDWAVQDGTLAIAIKQFGTDVQGQFDNWTAFIAFDPKVTNGKAGNVEAVIDISSLSLGSVTQQAMGPAYFDTQTFATATFTGEIMATDMPEMYDVNGVLSLKGIENDLDLSVKIRTLDNGTATAKGSGIVQRLEYKIGTDQTDASSLGFEVAISFELTATRQ